MPSGVTLIQSIAAMKNRIRKILTNLESVREDLLALSDDIWLSINHNDSGALQEGVQFKLEYNDKLNTFNRLSGDISRLVQHFTATDLETLPEPETQHHLAREQRERIIRELDRQTPHGLDEDWRYKRPHGLVLQGEPYVGVVTWRRVYEIVCNHLAELNPPLFKTLPEHERFISNRGNQAFSADPELLRYPMELTAGLHAEANLSANSIRDNISTLLDVFGIDIGEFRAYFREDRDAEE
jgi:hypothetical protein